MCAVQAMALQAVPPAAGSDQFAVVAAVRVRELALPLRVRELARSFAGMRGAIDGQQAVPPAAEQAEVDGAICEHGWRQWEEGHSCHAWVLGMLVRLCHIHRI